MIYQKFQENSIFVSCVSNTTLKTTGWFGYDVG
jgi:hypothetical protein